MKSVFLRALALAVFFTATATQAASTVGQHYIERIAKGGPNTVRDVAKSIRQTGLDEVEVLDALAERVWRDHKKPGGTQIDATAWGIIALGSSGNSRYHSVVKNIYDSTEYRKVRKHAKRSLKSLTDSSVEQYTPGTVNLAKARSAKKTQAKPKASSTGKVSLSDIKVGMTMQEVQSLAGAPTSSHNHITGKAFNPFNVTGRDAHRMIYYYAGQGRIVFSNQSAYTSTYRVSDVVLDSDESGYP